ncbi:MULTISPECIES: hypothetical protein [unclassified Arcicella]|uniref:hypothetical protein n=1 Tax=unclassified Arcicella TaxID=2644986 RepID=UPI00285B6560|nr:MULTISPECIES: hypothetical protein [unclassified Arcicella]MDR6564602.1 hypothetical protein [Arcicella sp. BE51]MDR6814470.1 hypothetical protein [Arcicella sp. BE140]MDR6825774.1 hypothetical protein [Arcicella sp. BE139]
MENGNNSQESNPLYFFLHAAIVFIIFILLTIWMNNSLQAGGADIGRFAFQGILYFIQILFILIAHKGTPNIKPAFFGATVTFIIVFIYEATY